MAHRLLRSGALVLLLISLAIIRLTPVSAGLGAQTATDYTSPTYGFSLTYDAAWTIPAHPPQHDADTLLLTNGVTSLAATAGANFHGDAQSCLTTLRTELAQEAGVSAVQPTGDQPNDPTLAASSDQLTFTPSGGAPVTLVLHLQCARVAGDAATVFLEAIAPADTDAVQAPAIAAVFDSVQAAGTASEAATTGSMAPLSIAAMLPFPVDTAISVTGDGVNLRTQPSTSGQVVTVLPAGASLIVTGPTQSADGYAWSPVKTSDGTSGYVASQFVGAATSATTAGVAAAAPAAAPTEAPAPAPQPAVSDQGAEPPAGAERANGCTYTNVDGNQVPCPQAAPVAPAGASAQCVDGTYSFSQHHQGTCSHHGGVAQWLQ